MICVCCCCRECCQHNIRNFFYASVATSMLVSVADIGLHADFHPYFSVFICQIVSWDLQGSCSGYVVYITPSNNSSNPIHRVLKALLLISMLDVAFG